jgi:phosphoribosylformylglycinamidine cyclo-ligase
MLVAVAPEDAQKLVDHLMAAGEAASVVGKLTDRTDEPVTFEGRLAL